jgi:phage terminase large subunit-like protein
VLEANRLEEKHVSVLRQADPQVKVVKVYATDGKLVRAEPVSAAYEGAKVHHVRDRRDPDRLQRLEAEMTAFDPRLRQASPNRMDALVWLVTYLLQLGDYRAPLVVSGGDDY